MNPTDGILPIVEITQVGQARRYAMSLAESLEFSAELTGTVGIVATEIASNLVKHANQSGQLFINLIEKNGRAGIEILALDYGPGIANIAHSMQDGVSTTQTRGIGLGGIKRLASEFDIFSQPGKGTGLVARVLAPGTDIILTQPEVRYGAISVPAPGEANIGDNWACERTDRNISVMVVDGLGHGDSAHEAAVAATEVFHKNHHLPLLEIFSLAHKALKHTRGAAMALARIDFNSGSIQNMAVGNIMTAVASPQLTKRLASTNGIVGLEFRSPKEFSYSFPPGATLIMCTDGIGTKWEVENYIGLLNKDPLLIAGVIYRDFKRGKDDTTVFALCERRTIQ